MFKKRQKFIKNNIKGSGIIGILIGLAITVLAGSAIMKNVLNISIQSFFLKKQLDTKVAKYFVLQHLRSNGAWNATVSKANGLNAGCFPGAENPASPGNPCPIMYYVDPSNNTDQNSYTNNSRRWIVPITGTNEGVGLISSSGNIFYADDEGCDEAKNSIEDYQACMNKEEAITIKLIGPSSPNFSQSSLSISSFKVILIENISKKSDEFSLVSKHILNIENTNLGYTPGTGWSPDPHQPEHCRVVIGENAAATRNCGIAIGRNATADDETVALGNGSYVSLYPDIPFGQQHGKAIGFDAQVYAGDVNRGNGVLGAHSYLEDGYGFALGAYSRVDILPGSYKFGAVSLGADSRCRQRRTMAIGTGAYSDVSTKIQFGSSSAFLIVGEPGNISGNTAGSITAKYAYANDLYGVNHYHCDIAMNCTQAHDYIFDYYFDGFVHDKYKSHIYQDKDFVFPKEGNDNIGIIIDYIRSKKHLPTFPNRKKVKKEGISLGEKTNSIWKNIEFQFLYIKELHEKLNKLKNEKQYKEYQINYIFEKNVRLIERLKAIDLKNQEINKTRQIKNGEVSNKIMELSEILNKRKRDEL